MSYSLRIKKSAVRDLDRIPETDRRRIVRAIDELAEQPLLGSPLKGVLRGLRRVRVGDYRIVYELLDRALVVLVVRIGRRRDLYRRQEQ